MPTGLASRCAVLLSLVAFGCGRLGYDLLTQSRNGSNDGGSATGGTVGVDGPDTSSGGLSGAGGAPGTGGNGARDAAAESGAALDGAHDGPLCLTQPSADYCEELPALATSPIIDGVLECGASLRPLAPQGWTGGSTPPDVSAELAVAWRPDGLYFFFSVTDASRLPADVGDDAWFGDGVEIYVDDDATYAAPPAYDPAGTRQYIVTAPPGASTPAARAQIYAYMNSGYPIDWISTEYGAYPTPGGYVVEAFVSAADLGLSSWLLSAGQRVGMNAGINVSFSDAAAAPDASTFGNRLGQFFLSIITTDGEPNPHPYFNPLAFCSPVLLAPQ